MFKQIIKLKKLKELERKGNVSISFDNHTSESLKQEIAKIQEEILEAINLVGWLIVFFVLVPLVLIQADFSDGSVVFISQFILFLSLFLTRMIKNGWDSTETKAIFYYLVAQILIYLMIIWSCGGSFCWEIGDGSDPEFN